VWLVIGALVVAGIAILGLLGREARPPTAPVATNERWQSESASAPEATSARVQTNESAIASSPPAIAPAESTLPPGTGKVFSVDSSGQLVLDEQTRLNMEALLARTEPNDLAAAKQQAVESLPPAAAAKAAELLDHYDNYQQAQRQMYPPGIAPPTEEAALAELEGLHSLRVAHFGADAAHAMYGAEETITRSLIELMRLEKDQSLTMEEKAVRAQQLRDSMPELAEIERKNREDPR
jgi:lipase chaperone LimK